MDTTPACHVIYVDRTATRDCPVVAGSKESPIPADWQPVTRQVVQALVEAFGNVYVCSTGSACLLKALEPSHGSLVDMKPTIVLLDTPCDDSVLRDTPAAPRRAASPESTPSPSRRSATACDPTVVVSSPSDVHTPDSELYGLGLMQKLMLEARLRNIAKLVVPIPIIRNETEVGPESESTTTAPAAATQTDGAVEHQPQSSGLATNRGIIRRCLALGAADVVIGPLSRRCIATLETCAYRARRDAVKEHEELLEIRRGRQRSWVGVSDEKPFAYLREAMVSGLMKRICRLGPVDDDDDHLSGVHVAVSSDRRARIADAVANWHFSAHLFTDDELLVAALIMFQHTLDMPGLERWRIPTDQLINFLAACRATYNTFVPYHNFRHVVDVLQATFNFLVHIGAVAPFPGSASEGPTTEGRSPMGSLIEPFEALTLLVTAIGHDVGHPGVNNGFLVTLNAPLAQLYNDRSVLESFHCAAYSQILRRYWPAVFDDTKMRKLMISSILATDMGLHFDYMKRLGDTQERLQVNNSTDGWNGRQMEEQKALACSLLIKCADISNVARRYEAALQWMHILSEEFSRQASMEDELQIPSALMAPPKKDIGSLAKAQLGFMNLFAIPLFQGVADIMPGMKYTVDELDINKGHFERMVEEEKMKELQDQQIITREGTLSPRSMSVAVGSGADDETPQAELRQEPSVKEETTEEAQHHDVPSPHLRGGEGDATAAPATTEGGNSGNMSSFDAVLQLANSDPFNSNSTGGLVGADGAQRRSETTEGSLSAGLAGDWASQATSAHTGRAPVSPSTQGTSIVSRESTTEDPSARSAPTTAATVPGCTVTEATPEGTPRALAADSSLAAAPAGHAGHAAGSSPSSTMRHQHFDEGSNSTGTNDVDSTTTGSMGSKNLRKKPSRFRIKDFNFFKRSKASSSPRPADSSASTS